MNKTEGKRRGPRKKIITCLNSFNNNSQVFFNFQILKKKVKKKTMKEETHFNWVSLNFSFHHHHHHHHHQPENVEQFPIWFFFYLHGQTMFCCV